MTKEVQVNSGGVGFFGLLTLVFVVAKLGGWIDWSWWLVFAPLYPGFVLVLVFLVLAAGVAASQR